MRAVLETFEKVNDLPPCVFGVVNNHVVAFFAGKASGVHEAVLGVNGGVSPQIVCLVRPVGSSHDNLLTSFINFGDRSFGGLQGVVTEHIDVVGGFAPRRARIADYDLASFLSGKISPLGRSRDAVYDRPTAIRECVLSSVGCADGDLLGIRIDFLELACNGMAPAARRNLCPHSLAIPKAANKQENCRNKR